MANTLDFTMQMDETKCFKLIHRHGSIQNNYNFQFILLEQSLYNFVREEQNSHNRNIPAPQNFDNILVCTCLLLSYHEQIPGEDLNNESTIVIRNTETPIKKCIQLCSTIFF